MLGRRIKCVRLSIYASPADALYDQQLNPCTMRLEGNIAGLQRYMIASQALPRYVAFFAVLIWRKHVRYGTII